MTEGIGKSDTHQSEGEEKGMTNPNVYDLPPLEADPCNPEVVREEEKMESDLSQNRIAGKKSIIRLLSYQTGFL